MIGVGCVFWVATMLGVAFSTKLWHFMLTQGVMQGIASGFIYPACVCATPTCDLPLRMTRTTVRPSFPMVPQKSWFLDWHSLVRVFLRYVQVVDASESMHSSKFRWRRNFCHDQSNAFTLRSSKDHVDESWDGRGRPRSRLPPHQRTAKTFEGNYLVR